MKIGLAAVDMQIVPKEQRRRDVTAFIDEAAAASCRMVLFPEYVNCQRTKEAADEWDAGRIDGLFARHGEEVPGGRVRDSLGGLLVGWASLPIPFPAFILR
jgi:predicted amidohydrolase